MASVVPQLEPSWDDLLHQSKVDTLCECIIWDPTGGKHLVRTAMAKRVIRVFGALPQACAYSFLNASYCDDDQKGLCIDDTTIVLAHGTPSVDAFRNVVELCSGIGVMSFGLERAGAHIRVRNDIRSPLVEFQKQDGTQHVIEGDIGDNRTLQKIFDIHQGSAVLTCGFSCQPWSALGDNRKFDDGRAQTLLHTLRAAYFFRSAGIILECVSGSGKDPDVQHILKTWCQATGFWYTDCILNLEHFWVARRERWWCLLSSPCIPKFELRSLPKQQLHHPVVADFLPIFPVWPQEQLQQLQIDAYEYGCFDRYGGIHSVLIDLHKPLSTALHGWGNQLTACPCSCRKGPMSLGRLASKGLFGALLPCDGMMTIQHEQVQCLRHIHPWECAILNGANADRQWMPNLKLGLCGLGQMASPFHSGWIFGQWLQQVGQIWDLGDMPSPEQVLWTLVGKAVTSRENMLPHILYSAYGSRLCAFVDSTHQLLFQTRSATLSPISIQQPSMTPSEILSDPSEHEAGVEPPSVVDDGYADITEWECPYVSCFICRPFVGATGLDAPTVHIGDTPEIASDKVRTIEISPTIAFQVDDDESSLPVIQHDGGVPAFRRKREHSSAFPGNVPPVHEHPTVPAESNDKHKNDKLNEMIDIQHLTQDDHMNQDPAIKELLVTPVHEPGPTATQVTSGVDRMNESHHVLLHFPDESNPLIVRVSTSSTVGQIVSTECAFVGYCDGTRRSVRVVDVVGQLVPWSQVTYPMQHLIIHPTESYIPHGCFQHSFPPSWFTTEDQCRRIVMLYKQEGWVAP